MGNGKVHVGLVRISGADLAKLLGYEGGRVVQVRMPVEMEGVIEMKVSHKSMEAVAVGEEMPFVGLGIEVAGWRCRRLR